jgi:hypothetical protein
MYKVIKKAISRELAEFCYDYFCNKRKVARLFFDARYISQFNTDWGVWNDEQVPETYSQYSDLVMETLLEKVQPIMEIEAEVKLNPTYSYARIYKKGDVLERHKDRYSCEISATMNLGGDPWKLFIDPTGKGEQTEERYKMGMAKGKSILMKPGDMVIYHGCDLEHWREAFEGENCGQVFFHYNDVNKKEAEENKFDTRPFLGLPTWFKGFKIDNTIN